MSRKSVAFNPASDSITEALKEVMTMVEEDRALLEIPMVELIKTFLQMGLRRNTQMPDDQELNGIKVRGSIVLRNCAKLFLGLAPIHGSKVEKIAECCQKQAIKLNPSCLS